MAQIGSDTCGEKGDSSVWTDRGDAHNRGRRRGELSQITWASADVVESELGNTGVELQQQGERLANTTGSTEDGDLGCLLDRADSRSAIGAPGRRKLSSEEAR